MTFLVANELPTVDISSSAVAPSTDEAEQNRPSNGSETVDDQSNTVNDVHCDQQTVAKDVVTIESQRQSADGTSIGPEVDHSAPIAVPGGDENK